MQESAPQATTLRERACRDILVWVNAGSGQEVIACHWLTLCSPRKYATASDPGTIIAVTFTSRWVFPEAMMHRSFGEAVRYQDFRGSILRARNLTTNIQTSEPHKLNAPPVVIRRLEAVR